MIIMSAFELKAIVADVYRDGMLPTVPALVLEIQDKTRLAGIIAFLGQRLPMASMSMQHLKRIDSKSSRFRILVCPVDGTDHDGDVVSQTIHHLTGEVQEFLLQYGRENLNVCTVPAMAPLTRNQYREASSLWPVNFHENKYLAGCLSGSLFAAERRHRICQLMQETLDLLRTPEAGADCSAALIVRHDGRHVVASALSRAQHPLHHAAMVAIAQVAQIHAREKRADGGSGHYQEDYLCTNYECFVSQEPCMMCAMALVHSRIKRVFFFAGGSRSQKSSGGGGGRCPDDGPYTVHGLHHNPNLNHRYEAWQLASFSPFPNKRLKS